MKIIAPKDIKIRFTLFIILFLTVSTIIGATFVVNIFNVMEVEAKKPLYNCVIIDAGHGGPDGGTSSSNGDLEKDINLQIALKLNEMLSSMGIKTIMTRTEDESIHDESAKTIREKKVSDIRNRLSIINNSENSVFVSIHQNHYPESKYNGTQVFYSKNNPHSQTLADSIRLSVISNLQPQNSREIKESDSGIYLLYHAEIPSVMVECGFLSNKKDTEKLKSEEYQRQMAFVISLGIIDFINKTEA